MQTTRFGRDGETAAEKYLEGKGYHFLTRNFKRTHGEIDLIMEDGETLVFIEVKSSTSAIQRKPSRAAAISKAGASVSTSSKSCRWRMGL